MNSKKYINNGVASQRGGSIRIAANTTLDGDNPYVRLFYRALLEHNIEFCYPFITSKQWLAKHKGQVDILHFQWPEFLVGRPPEFTKKIIQVKGGWRLCRLLEPLNGTLRARELRKFLSEAKKNFLIVWTLHNLEPHETSTHRQEVFFNELATACDLIVCHDEDVKQQALTNFKITGTVVVIPHGNYDGVYPAPQPNKQTRSDLRLRKDLPLVSCLGQIRDYKGFEIACEAASRLDNRVQLLIAGAPHRDFDLTAFNDWNQRCDNITVLARRTSDQEFADFTAASDCVILPYRKISGSGALHAAWTLGRGVIASDLAYFRRYQETGTEAIKLFRLGDADSLCKAIMEYLSTPASTRKLAARRMAESHAWRDCVVPVASAMQSLFDKEHKK